MTFIITLIAWILERFFHWHHLKRWEWFTHYEKWLSVHIKTWQPYLRLLINVLPPLMVVGFINVLLSSFLYGIFKFIFGVFVLLYCLGPENLWVEVYQKIEQNHKGEKKAVDHVEYFHEKFVRSIFIKANDRIFAVMFWFVLLGPIGAVLYRLIDIFSVREEYGLMPIAVQSKQVLDWIPIRIFTFFFALGGHFTDVIGIWKKHFTQGLEMNEFLLTECGMAALDRESPNQDISSLGKDALGLLDRAFVMGLVVLAICVLIL